MKFNRVNNYMEKAEREFLKYMERPNKYNLLEAYTNTVKALALAEELKSDWSYDEILMIYIFLWDRILFTK